MSYTMGLYSIHLDCLWGKMISGFALGIFPFISMRQVTSATAVCLGWDMQMDLDSAECFSLQNFSSVSKTSFIIHVHSFLVPCLVHPTVMTFGMVKSLPKMIDPTHLCTYYERVCKSVFHLLWKSYVVIPLVSMVMTCSTFEGRHETSVQVVVFEFLICVQNSYNSSSALVSQ